MYFEVFEYINASATRKKKVLLTRVSLSGAVRMGINKKLKAAA
jgi:hypothetical protein